ncbi:MAG: DUF4062 domain-containing protein, partial [Deltaproteobacteria bacterium]|nr:DUF4062 domain-containing protein [Deltaproteobacteria bacterium]
MEWKLVPVFISSTFNDMHAERDYLVKYVFPELAEWCEERRLRLIDIDLRWGVTREESESFNAVRKCLENIETCRPFFLCLIGQRRGWVPNDPLRIEFERKMRTQDRVQDSVQDSAQDKGQGGQSIAFTEISPETDSEFPEIKKHDSKKSVTEIEIEHALLEPMYMVINQEAKPPGQPCQAVFFERSPDWLPDDFSEAHKKIYTN